MNTCKICGTDISGLRKSATICRGADCKRTKKRRRDRAEREKAREDAGKICPVCGTELEKGQKVYCSGTCYTMSKSQREFGQRTIHLKATHKEPKTEKILISMPGDFSHSKYKAEVKAARKPNGWKCIVCGKALKGPNRYRCEDHRSKLKHSNWNKDTFMGEGGSTGGRTSAMGVMG
jgi:predicted nucleic acid-binding Zn ribbon protein